jgi:hypothetical protein
MLDSHSDLGQKRGPCLNPACDGTVTFDGSGSHNFPGQSETEPAWCTNPECRLRHERNVHSGFVGARWHDDDSQLDAAPDVDGGYYLT